MDDEATLIKQEFEPEKTGGEKVEENIESENVDQKSGIHTNKVEEKEKV